jgi:DNA modification methylase
VSNTIRKEVIGDATLYLGDCRDVLPSLTGMDAVVTDPPYGIAYESNYVGKTTTASWMNTQIVNDGDTSVRDFFLDDRWDAWACFGSIKIPPPPNARNHRATLVWDKGPASGMGDLSFPWKPSFELIFVGGVGWAGSRDEGVIKNCWMVTRASMGRVHPNEKPVELLRHICGKAPGQSILDPFMGSGTTGVACAKLGRRFTGIEIHEPYFDIACRRIEEAQRHKDLFVHTPAEDPADTRIADLFREPDE